jgi:hypothetical protein
LGQSDLRVTWGVDGDARPAAPRRALHDDDDDDDDHHHHPLRARSVLCDDDGLAASPIASTLVRSLPPTLPPQAAFRPPYTKCNLFPPAGAPLARRQALFRTLRTSYVWHLGTTRVRNSGYAQNSFSALDDLLPRPRAPWCATTTRRTQNEFETFETRPYISLFFTVIPPDFAIGEAGTLIKSSRPLVIVVGGRTPSLLATTTQTPYVP